MGYALFLKALGPIDEAVVAESFRDAPELTALDAKRALQQPSGVLARKLPRQSADRVAASLAARGVAVEVVEDAWLFLPPPTVLHQYDVDEGGLLYEVVGHPMRLSWSQIVILSVGEVKRAKNVKVAGAGRRRGLVLDGVYRPVYRTEDLPTPIIEIIADEPPRRLRIRPAPMDEGTERAITKIADLTRQIGTRAPQAKLNEGAKQILEGERAAATYRSHHDTAGSPSSVYGYGSVIMFDSELSWLLWRRRAAAEHGASPMFSATEQTTFRPPPSTHSQALQTRLEDQLETTRRTDTVVAAGGGLLLSVMLTARLETLGTTWTVLMASAWLVSATLIYGYLRNRRRRSFWTG